MIGLLHQVVESLFRMVSRGGEEYAGEVLALPVASAFRFLRRRLSHLIFLSRLQPNIYVIESRGERYANN
jgi:hypothetical protein